MSLPSRTEREALHAAAYLDIAVPLVNLNGKFLGPRVVALTPWRLSLLSLYSSPALGGGSCSRTQLLQALWLLNEKFRIGSRLRFRLFCLRWGPHSLSPFWRYQVRGALTRWQKLQFMSAPPHESKNNAVPSDPGEHWLAAGITSFAKVLGWREKEVLHTPYAVMFEYLAGRHDTAPDRPQFNAERDAQAKRCLLAKRRKAASQLSVSR